MRKFWIALLILWVPACGTPSMQGYAGGPPMRPEVFFAGQTLGQGVLTYRNGSVDRQFTVESQGVELQGGGFAIDQRITFDDGESYQRRWRLDDVRGPTYGGVLTDASGPVQAQTHGSVLTLSYPLMDVPLGRMHQYLYLQPDGKTVVNEGVVRVLGFTVRRLHEVIEIVQPEEVTSEG